MDISRLEIKVQEDLGEYSSKVFDSPTEINFIPLANSLSVAELLGAFQNIDEVDQNSELGEKLSHIIVLSKTIEEKYDQARRVFTQVQDLFREENQVFNLTDAEIEEVEQALLSKTKNAEELILSSDKVYEVVCKYFANNAAVNSGAFIEGGSVSVEELEKIDKKVAYHAKKTAFDQACSSVFGRNSDDYSKGLMVEYVGNKHELNELMGGDKLKSNQLAIMFVSMEQVNPLNIPKFGEILDPTSGNMLKINHLQQEDNLSKNILKIPCEVVGKNVIIEVPIYKGVIIAERT